MPMLGVRKLNRLLKPKLQANGIKIGRDQLFDLLRDHNLLVHHNKRYVRTTQSYHRFRKYNNLINDLEITRPNQVFVSDITYVDTLEGFCYLALITDAYSRKIVGYSLSQSLSIDFCMDALQMALKGIKQPEKLIHHSDRGIQYCSHAYVELLQENNVKISMTQQDHVYENALAERVNGILKTEFMLGEKLTSFAIAKELVKQSIKIYNEERPHMSIDYLTPQMKHAA
jgi:transposase InsO family protein